MGLGAQGKSKKEAKQFAAAEALEVLLENVPPIDILGNRTSKYLQMVRPHRVLSCSAS